MINPTVPTTPPLCVRTEVVHFIFINTKGQQEMASELHSLKCNQVDTVKYKEV